MIWPLSMVPAPTGHEPAPPRRDAEVTYRAGCPGCGEEADWTAIAETNPSSGQQRLATINVSCPCSAI